MKLDIATMDKFIDYFIFYISEVIHIGDITLYRIGELAKVAGISHRTIDYYTKLGLIAPESRTEKNYRLYSTETSARLMRINQLKQEKYTLDEIKEKLDKWNMVTEEEQVSDKLTHLELRMVQLEKEVRELSPIIEQMKPVQANRMLRKLFPQGAACIEALKILLDHGPLM